MTSINIFNKSCCKIGTYPIFGTVSVYMNRDENMGKCLIHEDMFVTPNMPKLRYALDFRVDNEKVVLTGKTDKSIKDGEQGHVFEKLDGFNLLFYKYKNRLVPKSRLRPMAAGKTLEIVRNKDFPIKNIEEVVNDGYMPYFEIHGKILDDMNMLHGKVRKHKGYLCVSLIAVAIKEDNDYRFLSPDKIIEIAKNYNLEHAPLHGIIDITFDNVLELMENAKKINRNDVVIEGYVVHTNNGRMYKVKPLSIMNYDVISTLTIPTDRIKSEINKVVLENDILDIAKNPIEFIKEVISYLGEDYTMKNKYNKKVQRIFIEEIARELCRSYNNIDVRELVELGVHPMLLGAYKCFSNQRR